MPLTCVRIVSRLKGQLFCATAWRSLDSHSFAQRTDERPPVPAFCRDVSLSAGSPNATCEVFLACAMAHAPVPFARTRGQLRLSRTPSSVVGHGGNVVVGMARERRPSTAPALPPLLLRSLLSPHASCSPPCAVARLPAACIDAKRAIVPPRFFVTRARLSDQKETWFRMNPRPSGRPSGSNVG